MTLPLKIANLGDAGGPGLTVPAWKADKAGDAPPGMNDGNAGDGEPRVRVLNTGEGEPRLRGFEGGR